MTTTDPDFAAIPKDEQRKARALARKPIKRHKTPTMEQFTKMTPAEQRVAIARDVLKHLDAKKFLATKGHYLRVFKAEALPEEFVIDEISTWAPNPWQVPELSLEQQSVVNGNACCVCALGAVFAAACDMAPIELGSVAQPYDNSGRGFAERMHDKLSPYFDASQLALMECAFERTASFDYGLGQRDKRLRAAEFGQRVALAVPGAVSYISTDVKVQKVQDERVLRAIMGNIIDNQGTFVP